MTFNLISRNLAKHHSRNVLLVGLSMRNLVYTLVTNRSKSRKCNNARTVEFAEEEEEEEEESFLPSSMSHRIDIFFVSRFSQTHTHKRQLEQKVPKSNTHLHKKAQKKSIEP